MAGQNSEVCPVFCKVPPWEEDLLRSWRNLKKRGKIPNSARTPIDGRGAGWTPYLPTKHLSLVPLPTCAGRDPPGRHERRPHEGARGRGRGDGHERCHDLPQLGAPSSSRLQLLELPGVHVRLARRRQRERVRGAGLVGLVGDDDAREALPVPDDARAKPAPAAGVPPLRQHGRTHLAPLRDGALVGGRDAGAARSRRRAEGARGPVELAAVAKPPLRHAHAAGARRRRRRRSLRRWRRWRWHGWREGGWRGCVHHRSTAWARAARGGQSSGRRRLRSGRRRCTAP